MCTRPNSWFDETKHCDAQKQTYLCWITPDRRNCIQHTHNSSEYAQLQCRFQCHHSILMTQKCVLARHVVPQCVRTQKMNSTCHDPFDLVFVNFQDVRQATINRGHGFVFNVFQGQSNCSHEPHLKIATVACDCMVATISRIFEIVLVVTVEPHLELFE